MKETNVPFEGKKELHERILNMLGEERYLSCQTCVYRDAHSSSACNDCEFLKGKSWELNLELDNWAFRGVCEEIEREDRQNSIENNSTYNFFRMADYENILRDLLEEDGMVICNICQYHTVPSNLDPCKNCTKESRKFILKKEFRKYHFIKKVVEAYDKAVRMELEKDEDDYEEGDD